MHYAMLVLFIVISVLLIMLNIKLIYLLFKLGFYFPVISSFVVQGIFVAMTVFILKSYEFSTGSLFFGSILLGMFVPGLIMANTKKVDPKKRKTKPKYMSQTEWNWLDYDIGKGSDSDIGGGGW